VAYYAYKDTRPGGKLRGMGTDKESADSGQQIELNAAIALQMQQSRVGKGNGSQAGNAAPVAGDPEHIELEDQRHARGKIAVNTINNKRWRCEAIRKAAWG